MAPLLAELMKEITSKDTENASPTSNIQDNLILEEMRVVHDGIHVGSGSDGVLEHFLVNGEMRVAVKVVIRIFDIANIGFLSFHLAVL